MRRGRREEREGRKVEEREGGREHCLASVELLEERTEDLLRGESEKHTNVNRVFRVRSIQPSVSTRERERANEPRCPVRGVN